MTPSCSARPSRPSPAARGEGRLEASVFTAPEDFLRLAPEWRALAAGSRPSHPFADPAWHACWWKHLGSGSLHICALRDAGGRLAAVAPLTVSAEGLLRFTGGEDLTDYIDIVAAEGVHAEAWRALLAHLEGPDGPDWREALLRGIPGKSPSRAILASPEGPLGGRGRLEREEVCPVIPLPDSWEEYVGMINARFERDLRCKLRKSEMETGLEVRRTMSPAELEADLEAFVELHALSHPEKAEFWNEARGAFFREMAREMQKLDLLDLTVMRVDGHPVAANFAFDDGERIYLYNSGYDPHERDLGPGLVLLARNIEEAINGGRSAFDLLRGDEAYKYQFGGVDEPVWALRLERGRG